MTRIRTLVHHTNPPALAGGCLVNNAALGRLPKKFTSRYELINEFRAKFRWAERHGLKST